MVFSKEFAVNIHKKENTALKMPWKSYGSLFIGYQMQPFFPLLKTNGLYIKVKYEKTLKL